MAEKVRKSSFGCGVETERFGTAHTAAVRSSSSIANCQHPTTFESFARFRPSIKSRQTFGFRFWAVYGQSGTWKFTPKVDYRSAMKSSAAVKEYCYFAGVRILIGTNHAVVELAITTIKTD